MDRERLTKLLAMTTSDNDGEALNALRMANKLLAAEQLTWEEVLGQPQHRGITVTVNGHAARYSGMSEAPLQGEWVPPHLTDAPTINMMFRTIQNCGAYYAANREFIDSVHNWWLRHKQLSVKQYNAIRRVYTMARVSQVQPQ